MSKKAISNPFSPSKITMHEILPLTAKPKSTTLMGGTAGHELDSEGVPHPRERLASVVHVAAGSAPFAAAILMKNALAALSVVFHGYLVSNRETLDLGVDDLIGCIEEFRDGVPKA